jgi:membrane protease YdiL (CAAX protease family)
MVFLTGIFSRISKFKDIILVLTGMFVFGSFIHEKTWMIAISYSGLFLAAVGIGIFLRDTKCITTILGAVQFNFRMIGFFLCGIAIGGILGLWYRIHTHETLFPSSLTFFALIAPLVGITEELIFRGYLQGRIQVSNRILSIIIAALGHTTYKFIVLRSLPDPSGIDISFLIIWTMIGGLIFGILRNLSDSVFPPSLAHASFDIIVYGNFVSAPIWVWG